MLVASSLLRVNIRSALDLDLQFLAARPSTGDVGIGNGSLVGAWLLFGRSFCEEVRQFPPPGWLIGDPSRNHYVLPGGVGIRGRRRIFAQGLWRIHGFGAGAGGEPEGNDECTKDPSQTGVQP